MSLFVAETGIAIRATGSYLPERKVTTAELTARADAPLSEAEVLRLTGIQTRRWVADDQATSDLAIAAGRLALERAGLDAVDRLLLSTTSPDNPSPATACLVQDKLGLPPCAAVDLSAACAGFLFALDWGARSIQTGDRSVLVIAADVRSRYLRLDDRTTFALFGDGAGAVVLESGPKGEGLLALYVISDGSGYDVITVPAGGSRLPASAETVAGGKHTIHIADGPRVFLTAIEGMTETAERLLAATGMTMDDIDLIVPHQPNGMILDRLVRYMRIPKEKLFFNVEHVGNMSSASVAVAFDQAMTTGRVRPGSLVMLLGGGAGYCSGAALLRIPEKRERQP